MKAALTPARRGGLKGRKRGLLQPGEHRIDNLAKTPVRSATGLIAAEVSERKEQDEVDLEDDGKVEQQPVADWAAATAQNDLLSLKRRYQRNVDPLETFGVRSGAPWRPSTSVREAREREIEAGRKPKTWAQYFREYRAYADCVLDVLRLAGVNASFVIRVATDRHWVTDVRDQKFWLEGVNRANRCAHFMYRGEGVFYGVQRGGTWKFGLKDLNSTFSRSGVVHQFPLENRQEDAEGGEDKMFDIPEEENLDEIHKEANRKKTIKAGRRATLVAKAAQHIP